MIDRIRQGRGESGYSMIEMLTVMVIMSIVFAAVTSVFVSGSKAQSDQDNRFQAQLGARVALDQIRRDIHCASNVASYTTSTVTLQRPTGCSGDVSWCTAPVTGYTNRYRLYRQLGTSCGSGTGIKVADYLTSGSVFPAFTHTSGFLASLEVDFAVSLKGSLTVDKYELTDTIYLRNSSRA